MTAPASPDTLRYSKAGEPFVFLLGKTSSSTLAYSKAGAPYVGAAAIVVVVASGAQVPCLMLLGVGA